MPDDLRNLYAEALAAKFTSPVYRCDRDGSNERSENPEPADRVEQTPSISFIAGDGHRSFRMPTCLEIAEVVAAVRDSELEAARKRAEQAEHALGDALPAITSGKPWEAERIIRAALDGTQDTDRG